MACCVFYHLWRGGKKRKRIMGKFHTTCPPIPNLQFMARSRCFVSSDTPARPNLDCLEVAAKVVSTAKVIAVLAVIVAVSVRLLLLVVDVVRDQCATEQTGTGTER